MKARLRDVMTVQLDFDDFCKHRDYSRCKDRADKEAREDSLKAQDMIAEIQKLHNCSVEEAIKIAVNPDNANRACDAGWACCAFDFWGHGDCRTEFQTVSPSVLSVEFSREQYECIQQVSREYENASPTLAVCYMLVFEMENMGHHI